MEFKVNPPSTEVIMSYQEIIQPELPIPEALCRELISLLKGLPKSFSFGVGTPGTIGYHKHKIYIDISLGGVIKLRLIDSEVYVSAESRVEIIELKRKIRSKDVNPKDSIFNCSVSIDTARYMLSNVITSERTNHHKYPELTTLDDIIVDLSFYFKQENNKNLFQGQMTKLREVRSIIYSVITDQTLYQDWIDSNGRKQLDD